MSESMLMVKPIPFSPPMVRAIDEGRKTMTRRVISPRTAEFGSAPRKFWSHSDFGRALVDSLPEHGQYLHVPCHEDDDDAVFCDVCRDMGWGGTSHRLWPRINPGDILWVREPWRTEARFDDLPPREIPQSTPIIFEADYPRDQDGECRGRSRPGMFLPRWASRLTLEVTSVKVERLQEISEEDADAEGMQRPFVTLDGQDWPVFESPVNAFARLWDSLNAKRGYAWEANPWVAAYSFRVYRVNVDDLLRSREAA